MCYRLYHARTQVSASYVILHLSHPIYHIVALGWHGVWLIAWSGEEQELPSTFSLGILCGEGTANTYVTSYRIDGSSEVGRFETREMLVEWQSNYQAHLKSLDDNDKMPSRRDCMLLSVWTLSEGTLNDLGKHAGWIIMCEVKPHPTEHSPIIPRRPHSIMWPFQMEEERPSHPLIIGDNLYIHPKTSCGPSWHQPLTSVQVAHTKVLDMWGWWLIIHQNILLE